MDENDGIVGADKASIIVLCAITENSGVVQADRARSLQWDKNSLGCQNLISIHNVTSRGLTDKVMLSNEN